MFMPAIGSVGMFMPAIGSVGMFMPAIGSAVRSGASPTALRPFAASTMPFERISSVAS